MTVPWAERRIAVIGGDERDPEIARLAAATGATLLVIGCWFTPDGWGIHFHPPVPVQGRHAVAGATQAVADCFAIDIAEHPQDWHMLQPLWTADLPVAPMRGAG